MITRLMAIGSVAAMVSHIVNTSCGGTLAEIAQSAAQGNVYVNAHSTAKPGGVARGELQGN